MFLVAFLAVYRSVAGWLERYFSFLTTVCASCLVHLSRTARSKATSSFAEAASSFIAHMLISCFGSSQQGLRSRFRMFRPISIVTWSPTFVPGTEITKPWMLKRDSSPGGNQIHSYSAHTFTCVWLSISFKPWGFHEPKNDDHPVYSPF